MEIRDFIEILTVEEFIEFKRRADEAKPLYYYEEDECTCGECNGLVTYAYKYCPYCGVQFEDRIDN